VFLWVLVWFFIAGITYRSYHCPPAVVQPSFKLAALGVAGIPEVAFHRSSPAWPFRVVYGIIFPLQMASMGAATATVLINGNCKLISTFLEMGCSIPVSPIPVPGGRNPSRSVIDGLQAFPPPGLKA